MDLHFKNITPSFAVGGFYLFSFFGFWASSFVEPTDFKLFCQSAFFCSALILFVFCSLSRHFAWFYVWLVSSRGVKYLILSTFIWLAFMLLFFGLNPANSLGVVSGALLLLCAPIFLFALLSRQRVSSQLFRLVGIQLMFLLFFEVVFLSWHYLFDLPLNISYHSTAGLTLREGLPLDIIPRVFLNVREGNLIALISFFYGFTFFGRYCESCDLVRRRHSLVIAYSLTTLSFVHGLMTLGRGYFLSIGVSIVFSFFVFIRAAAVRQYVFLALRAIVFICACLVLAYLFCGFLSVFARGHDFNYFVNAFLGRFHVLSSSPISPEASLGRLVLWRVWLAQGFLNSPWIGSGFNFVPILPDVYVGDSNAHNLWVQLLADAGLLGIVIALSWILCLYRYRVYVAFGRRVSLFLAAIGFFFYCSFSSLFSFPSGCWGLTLLAPMFCDALSPDLELSFNSPAPAPRLFPFLYAALVSCFVFLFFALSVC